MPLLLAPLTVWGAAAAIGAPAVDPKDGKYKGATQQETVVKSERNIQFKVKGRRIILTKEPAVALGSCVTPPTFLPEPGDTVRSKISGRGTFSFTHTFLGSRFDKIEGRFVSDSRIEGEVLYHFHPSATCGGGKTKTTFRAKR
jgi:hypothetical protein